jgi:hypothetical protein
MLATSAAWERRHLAGRLDDLLCIRRSKDPNAGKMLQDAGAPKQAMTNL